MRDLLVGLGIFWGMIIGAFLISFPVASLATYLAANYGEVVATLSIMGIIGVVGSVALIVGGWLLDR